jgi:DNA-binding LacI/PurR family transcriptional regulator
MSRSVYASRKRRGATMQDVADLLHVSKQTVSAVINNKPGITQETRERVLAAIAQVNYKMDMTARSLRTGRTNTVALVVTDVSSPILGMMATAVEEQMYAEHYNVVLYNTHDDNARERLAINSILQRSVDGVLFVAATDASDALDTLEAEGIPVVVIDRVPQRYSGPAIVLDNLAAGRLAAEHLVKLGHTRLAHIGGPANTHIARDRLLGFERALAHHGRPAPLVVLGDDWHVEAGYGAMKRLLAGGESFSALFCAGDPLAIGAMRALAEAGLRIPQDVSVVGLDDIEVAPYLLPPLTTIRQPSAEMARQGVSLLMKLLTAAPDRPVQTPERIVVQPSLVVRGSTAPPGG